MTTTENKFDAAKPFYAWVGAADLAVEKLRESVADAQGRDLKVLAAQAGTQLSEAFDEVVAELQEELAALPQTVQARLEKLPQELKALPKRLEALVEDAGDLPRSAQARLEELQAEAKALRAKVEAIFDARRAGFADLVEEHVEAFEELAVRGRAFVAKLRDDSISGDVEIIDPDAEVVKDVSPAVEKAAGEAAKKASAARKAPAAKKAPASKKTATTKASATKPTA